MGRALIVSRLVLVAEDGDRILTSDPVDIRRLVLAAGKLCPVIGC